MDTEQWEGAAVPGELAEFLREAAEYQPVLLAGCVCEGCGGRAFTVWVDDAEGCAGRGCVRCGQLAFLADSAEVWVDAEPGSAECPCGGDEFEAAVAFSLTADGSVRWVTVGLRCLRDGALGVYADWKIDYTPTDHLLRAV